MSGQRSECHGIGELADYWTIDLPPDEAARIEAHVFECADCARGLAETGALARGIAELVRAGRFQAVITDDVLNRLAREGVRVRTYVLEPEAIVPCAVWADDDLVVTRLRADFGAFTSATVVTEVGASEVDRVNGVPVHAGMREIVEAFSAARLRQMPQVEVRLTLFGSIGDEEPERPIARYVLEHGGALDREHR